MNSVLQTTATTIALSSVCFFFYEKEVCFRFDGSLKDSVGIHFFTALHLKDQCFTIGAIGQRLTHKKTRFMVVDPSFGINPESRSVILYESVSDFHFDGSRSWM